MTLTVHHLGKSQSERIVWLCEELGIPYELKVYRRSPMLAPPDYKALHPLGSAPVITDGKLVLAESGAIMDYIMATHGNGRLSIAAGEPQFADYLYWFHFVNGTLQPAMMDGILLAQGLADENPLKPLMVQRPERALRLIEDRLGDVPYLAGDDLTAADIMIVFTLTTMRYFAPFDLSPYPNILAYLRRIGERPAYRRAMAKGDPDMAPMLD
jgi:glutathione S-transferase